MESKTFAFHVEGHEELAAGIRGFTDKVTVIVDSGQPGGDEGQFEEWIRASLAEWYDGAAVENWETAQQRMAEAEAAFVRLQQD